MRHEHVISGTEWRIVAERARTLAERLLRTESDDTSRVKQAWVTVLGREPAAWEASSSLSYLAGFPKAPADDDGRLLKWTSLCRTLLASNDFVYLQ